MNVILDSTITCPECGFSETLTMSTSSCEIFYKCPECEAVSLAKDGDCCVFCSYADVPCPPIQEMRAKDNDSGECSSCNTGEE